MKVPNDLRFSLGSSDVLTRVAVLLSKGQEKRDPLLEKLMSSGVMDTVKVAGSKTFGAGQAAAETASNTAERTSQRLQDAWNQVCEHFHRTVGTFPLTLVVDLRSRTGQPGIP